jgi:hypothetical protein
VRRGGAQPNGRVAAWEDLVKPLRSVKRSATLVLVRMLSPPARAPASDCRDAVPRRPSPLQAARRCTWRSRPFGGPGIEDSAPGPDRKHEAGYSTRSMDSSCKPSHLFLSSETRVRRQSCPDRRPVLGQPRRLLGNDGGPAAKLPVAMASLHCEGLIEYVCGHTWSGTPRCLARRRAERDRASEPGRSPVRSRAVAPCVGEDLRSLVKASHRVSQATSGSASPGRRCGQGSSGCRHWRVVEHGTRRSG